jgi:hypothetical protein
MKIQLGLKFFRQLQIKNVVIFSKIGHCEFLSSTQYRSALSGQRLIVYNGLLWTTAFFVQRPPKTGHRPFSYNGL